VVDDLARWTSGTLVAWGTADDRINGVFVTFVDITERKHSEERIRGARIFARKSWTQSQPLPVLTPELEVASPTNALSGAARQARGGNRPVYLAIDSGDLRNCAGSWMNCRPS
jgi:hypothetical protein